MTEKILSALNETLSPHTFEVIEKAYTSNKKEYVKIQIDKKISYLQMITGYEDKVVDNSIVIAKKQLEIFDKANDELEKEAKKNNERQRVVAEMDMAEVTKTTYKDLL